MKKILSIFMLITLVFNMFAINAFAQTTTIDVSFSGEDSGTVTVKVTSEANTDLFVKITNKNQDKIIYLKSVLAKENTGTFTVDFKKETLGFDIPYIVTASVANGAGSEKEFEVEHNIPKPPVYDNSNSNSNVPIKPKDTTLENQDGHKQNNLIESASDVKTIAEAKTTINELAKGVTEETKALSDTSENAALVTSAMARNISSKKVNVSIGNKLTLTSSSISAGDLSKVESTVNYIKSTISQNGYVYNREIEKELVLKVSFNKSKKATIVISRSILNALKGIDVLTILDEDFQVSFRIEDLEKELAEMPAGKNFEIYIERVEVVEENGKLSASLFDGLSSGDYRHIALAKKKSAKKVSFNKEKLAGNVNVSVASSSTSNTDFQTLKNVEENTVIGGKYNAATGMVEAGVGAGGTYIVEENRVDFSDIEKKSAAMQEAIKVLAAKGIIEGVGEGKFSPDAMLTRAEFVKLLVKTLYTNTSGEGFVDTAGTWYESYAKAGRGAGIISGYEDGTFRGDTVISKEQIIAVAARTLREKKKYYNPTDPDKYLSSFKDKANIPEWAKVDISLATRENLVIARTDGNFSGKFNMSRGEAALIVKKLFDRL